ncbi:FctA domain-containing protein [Collinsella sp. CLA-ER-H7]|uniref:Spy0128 family protein n=1 Tax=Collinsella sp. CLA-ER-H7 TaxID=3136230 RepID=UPI0032C1C010
MLLKPDGSVLSFDEEHANKNDYFVLKEVSLPKGYRSSLTSSTTATPGELHLQYKAAASGTGGAVVAPQTTVTTADDKSWTGSRMWLNGGYLAAKETISLSKETKDNKDKPISLGTTFAVVLKRTDKSKSDTDESAWTAVTGNPLEGYKLCSAHGIAGAVEAAKSADTSVFGVNTKGDYEVTVRSLPGDIEKYAAMMTDKSQSEYTVAVYHTTASSLAEATIDNTSMVQYQTINRQFSTVIHLTNVQNRLFVQKVDDLGKPVNGATFELYQAKDVTGDSPSTYAIEAGATPYDTVQANGMTYPYDIEGAACFPLDSTKHAPLIKGTYYLRESVSPDGHEINNTITKVIVDDSGVYVDAGKEDDGVRSMSGPGSLIASLAQFGSPDSIDNTLTHIKGKLQSATVDASGSLTWGQECTAEGVTPSLANDLMHMRYDKTAQGTKTVLRYVEDGGERNGQLATIFADTGINRMALYQDDDATNGTDLGTLQLNHLFTTATAVQYTDRRVARLQVTKTVTADSGLTAPTKDFTFKFTLPDSEKGYEAHVFDANGKAVGNSFMLNNGDTHSIKAGETIRVYDLKKGDNYSVSELTTKGEASSGNVLASIVNTVTGSADESVLPAGFSLVSRKVGGKEQSGTGNTIEGKIVALAGGQIPADNTLEFTNNYSAKSVTLDAQNRLGAKKLLEGRDWADGDSFTVQLTADDGVPMPNGAKSKVSTVELTKNSQTQTVGDITYKTATFGDITYAKPGTYTYTISEVIPGSDAGADGISYSAARYKAEVVVEDNQAGALVVKSVKMTQERNDAGDDTKTEVADAIFTNRYDEHERNITIHAQKSLTDNAGTFLLAQNTFSFTLEGMGGYADDDAAFDPKTVVPSIKPPMPQGTEGNTATVGNNADDGAVTWPAISYTAKPDAGRAYVYKFAENPGSVTGMTYDGSVYYAVVRNAEKGAGIQTSVEYYKAAEDGSVEKLDNNATPSFTNIYSVKPTSVTLQGQKTVSGRDWNQDESYTFNLAAAADDDGATSLGKTTKQAVTDGVVVINTNQAVASTPESGRMASFSFGTEAAPTVTFNRAGTFSFNITEDAAQDGQAGMSMDKHTARATVVVTDLDESGNHAGELRVSSVTYANTGASDVDKPVTDKAAFTNAYHASGTFGGMTVSKALEGRASIAGQFTFAVTGLWYNGVQTSVDGAEASLSNKAAEAGVSGAVVGASGQEKLFARTLTEQDLGHTFAYRIHENQPAAAAGYAYDIGYTGDAIVLVKVLARKNDPAKLYTVTTVLKGTGVTELLGDGADASALTDEKIVELKQKPNTYVQQYDASEVGATTPAVSFVNRYEASLDYGAAGGLQIEKTLTYPKDATIFGSPKSTFRYIVKPADETSASKVGISTDGRVFETANVEADAPKTVSLVTASGLTFTQDDAGKTFTYTVSEIDDKATGYTYDKTVHTVRAVVADNGDGTLRVTTSVSKQVDGKDELEGQWIYPSGATSTGVATVKFKNTYTVTEAATYTPSVTKVVAGADAPGKFTFAMTAADDATKAAISGNLITGSSMSADNGYVEKKQTKEGLKDGEHYQVDFSKLTFNKPGTYKFAINELAPNGGLGEWKYDQHIYTVTVTVTDEGGKLVARDDGTTGSEGFIFTNSYQTSTSYELQGGLEIVKTLNGHDLHAGMFGFTVTGEDDASIEKLNKLLRADEGKLTVTNDEPQADGTSHTGILGGLTFATKDAGKTFTYKVVENDGGKGGYTYDSTYWKVEIAVKKRDNGSLYTVTTAKHYDAKNVELSADAKLSSESGTAKAQVSFTNSYIAKGTFEGLAAEKVMDSRDKIEADQYTFDLYAEKADGSLEKMDEGTTQADEDGTATVDFGKVNFKLGDATSGTHEQTIDLAGAVNDGIATKRHNADHTTTYSFNLVAKERMANLPEGVRPVDTSATCRVLLEVTDHNDGNLTSKVTYRDGTEKGKIVFHNTRDKVKTIGTVAKPDVDIDGQLLSVGDSYVYTINWANTEADAAGNLVSANVTVTDELPTGVVFEAFEGEFADKGAASGQLLTWNLGKQPAGSHGSVRVRVKITEDAVKGAQGAVGAINNTATVKVGDKSKSYTGTTTNFVPKKSENDAQDSKGSGVRLGDELTYTIGYKNTENAPATVVITDAVPAGTEFVEFAGDHKDAGSKDNDGNLTWALKDVPAGKEGTVQFKVRVTEDAFKSGGASGDISNQASVAVGNNPAVKTNTTTDQVSDGRLTLSKTVTAAEGITAPNKAFTFKVLLYQADGTTPLAGTFAYAGRPDGTNGTYVSGQIKSGDTIALKAGGSVTVTLPIGAHYEVQELDSKGELMTSEDGFAVVDKANPQKGTVGQATKVGFTNVYSVESTKVENAFKVQKKISGRNWTKADAFTMMLTAQGEAPMPKGAKEGVSTIELHKDAQVGNFGTIEYTKPGTYTYVITEPSGDETSLIFSKATYRATVTVTDNGAGKLSAKTKIAQLTDDAGDAAERTVEAAVFTNTAKTGSLTVKKTVVGGDSQREFGFAVTLTDGDGEPVSGTFGKGEHAVTFTDGKATFTLKDGGEKTIAGLPVGARYTVTEDAAEGYTTTVNGADGSKAEGAVTEDGATVAFTNTYGTVTEGRDVSTAGLFTKALKGRDWAEGDSFQFTLTGEGGAPMPEGSADGSKTVSVTAAAGTKAGDRVAFDFGAIRYTLNDIKDAGFAEVGGKRVRAKTFTYTVREARPDDGSAIAGVAYDGHVATMTVTVADDGSGNLTATTPAIAQASGGDFVNTYTTELDYSARAGVRLSKTLSGRAMEAGQFAFTVTADAETAAKLGLKTDKDAYAVAAADDGEADLIDLVGGAAGSDAKFTDADAGKTYSFTVTETKLGGEGYANDTAPRTVTIAPAYDAATGKLTVTTTVAKDGVEVARSEVSTADDVTATPAPVTVAFENSYEATGTLGGEGNVAINATKTLAGRAAAAGEFSFSVRDAQGNVVATATNQASGDGEAAGLAFSPIAYTTDALERMVAGGIATRAADGSWVIPYTVSEDGTDRLPAGVTATASSFDITVKVTDNGKGGLDTAVVYPEGSDGTLSFVNGYSADEATVDIAGTKTLALGQAGLGLAQADIAGKYTFKIEPLDGAPAPVDASGKTVTEATNDAAGNVELGSVTFRQPSDLDDVEIDGDGLRTKTFAYRVSESGSVDGVVNDATATRTFTVRVVEDTNAGTLAAEVLPAEGTPKGKGAFEFTNTYGVNPTPSSVTDQIKVSKKLKGRDLAEGEFEFQLVELAADGSENIAATGKNAADGTVALSPVTYTAPGTHGYELREVAGTAGGVTYDKTTYRVRTTVVDAGNGTLVVKHELMDAGGNAANETSVTFTNGYEAAPVTLKLGAAKVLKGAELKAGQFSFELKSRDGKVMSIAKNAADGSVTFDALTFKQAGTYTFTVSEVDDGQAHVTYDKAVHKIVVTVSDEAADGTKTGYLSAKVSYEGDAGLPPVSTNSYAEEPGTPENPGTPGGGSGGGSDNGSGGSSGDGSKGGMPDTGDRSLPVEALAAMAGIGALTAAGGAVLYRRRR